MEPNENKQPPTTAQNNPGDDLHAEGIDLLGSGVSDENEFSSKTPDEKADESAQTTPEPVAPAPAPQPAKPIAPEAPKEMPMVAKQAFYTPASQPIEAKPVEKPTEKPKNDASIKPLRTFKSDAEEAVRYGGVSKIGMVVAEQNKRQAADIERVEEKKFPVVAFSIVALVAIVGAGAWFYWSNTSVTGEPATGTHQPVIAIKTLLPYVKASLAIETPLENTLDIISGKLASADAPLNSIYAVIPVASATSTVQAPLQAVMSNTHIPSRLARALTGEYMFGLYTYDVQGAFLVLKNSFYQNAFAGMLEWEKDIRDDLAGFIAFSHPTTDSSIIEKAPFVDMVISNIDVRAIKDGTGTILLAYAFTDKDTIVIATSQTALKFMIDRLLQVRTIQ